MYDRIYCRIVCGRDSVHAGTFSRNIQAHAPLHVHTINRNGCVCSSAIIRACASASIIVHTFVCLFVHAWASVSTHACDSGIICDCGCCSVCLSVILYNILLWGDLGHGYTAAHVYIQIYIKDYLYHSLESPECCSLQWLGDKICIQLSRWALFKWKVPVFITILYKELFHSGLLCLLRDWLFIILFHENSTHVILVELDLLHCISLSLNEVSQPQALRQSVVWFHYLGLSWAPPIYFLLPQNVHYWPWSHGHHCSIVNLSVLVCGKGRINQPFEGTHDVDL